MGHLRETIHIAAPVDQVWDLGADARRMTEWDVNTLEVRDCPDRIDWVGAKFTSVSRVMGRQLTTTSETTKVVKPSFLEQQIVLPGGGHASASMTFEVTATGTDETISIDYELPGGLFAGVAEKLLASSIERDFRHGNENFKALCEAAVPQPA